MNNYEVYYKDSLYIIDVIGKKDNLNIINITRKNKDYSFNLGNFYTELPYLVSEEDMFNLTKNLVDNIDKIIFEKNRCIGDIKDEINKKSNIDVELEKIYTEFIGMEKNTKEYAKYARFLELYFYGHNIPDGIRYLYLKRKNKSILDYKNVDESIKYSFRYNIADLKEESEYKNNVILVEELKSDLKIKENELEMLNNIISFVTSIVNKIKENDNISLTMEDLECKLKSISFFDKKRNKIKNKLKDLKSEVVDINIEDSRKKIYEEYLNYSNIYGDKHGMLVLFDKLEIDDILSLLESVFSSKEKVYLNELEKINSLNEEISNYDDNTVDISDLYERLEG